MRKKSVDWSGRCSTATKEVWMSKKVSELIKDLDISIQELKGYADKLGIAISSARSNIEDQAAERLTRSINMMRGTSSGDKSGGNKPRIKAVPVVPKDGARPKPPMGKPVIPKKPAAPVKEEPVEEKPEEKVTAAPEPEVVETEVKAAEVPAAAKEPEAPEQPAEKPAEPEKPAEEKTAAAPEPAAEKPAEKPAEAPVEVM